jgi:hypothetical protein
MSAIRKLAGEAADNGLLAPELAAWISRVKSVKSTGIRAGNWLSLRQAVKGGVKRDHWGGEKVDHFLGEFGLWFEGFAGAAGA